MGVWGEGSVTVIERSVVWRQSWKSHWISYWDGIPSSMWDDMPIYGPIWLRFWGMQAYLKSTWVDWLQSQDGMSFACGRWPVEWPGMHPIILAHSAAMAGWARKARPKKSVMKVMIDVLLFISTSYPNSCDFYTTRFDTLSAFTAVLQEGLWNNSKP